MILFKIVIFKILINKVPPLFIFCQTFTICRIFTIVNGKIMIYICIRKNRVNECSLLTSGNFIKLYETRKNIMYRLMLFQFCVFSNPS